MEDTFMERVLRWANNAQENLDPMADTLDDGTAVYFVRLRPWKQVKGHEVMSVGHGETLEVAARAAVASWKGGHEEKLDWAARPWRVPRGMGGIAGPGTDIPF